MGSAWLSGRVLRAMTRRILRNPTSIVRLTKRFGLLPRVSSSATDLQVSGEEMQSKTKIALIDLAGSERSDKLGSVGKALQEGNNINQSLTVLGRCIKSLVEQANNPKKKIQVPFRESVLTWYLRESLAG